MMHLTPDQASDIIRELLLTRRGEIIDEATATERARNIASALIDTYIGTPDMVPIELIVED